MLSLRNAMTALAVLLWCFVPLLCEAADIKTHTEVEDLLNRHAEAYSKKDLQSIMSLFAADPEVTLVIGGAHQARYVGPDQIRESYEADFAATTSAVMKHNWISVHSKGDIAWFASECVSTIEMEKQKFTFPVLWTGLAEKRDNKWVFVQCHVSIPTPEAQDSQ